MTNQKHEHVDEKGEPYEELARELRQILASIRRVVESRRDQDTCLLSKRACQALIGHFDFRDESMEQAARQIAEIWGVKGSKDFDEECILGILRETIGGKR